jgi:hypothetical protein
MLLKPGLKPRPCSLYPSPSTDYTVLAPSNDKVETSICFMHTFRYSILFTMQCPRLLKTTPPKLQYLEYVTSQDVFQ